MFLLPYRVTFIIKYVTKTAFYHYRLQESYFTFLALLKAILKVLKNATLCARKLSIKVLCYFLYTLCYF